MDAQTALDTLLARIKERAEHAQFASGDPDIESLAIPVFVVEEIIADLTQTPSAPSTVADLDGTDDSADWITPGHVLDTDDVTYLRSLRLP